MQRKKSTKEEEKVQTNFIPFPFTEYTYEIKTQNNDLFLYKKITSGGLIMKLKKHMMSLATLCFCLLTLLPILPPPTAPDPKPPIGIEPEKPLPDPKQPEHPEVPGITPQDDRGRPPKV